MINDWIARISIYVAVVGASVSVGFGFGVAYSAKDAARKVADAMAKREKQIVEVDRIVTKYVDRIVEREVKVYVPNDNDCEFVSYDYGLFFNSVAADQRLPETTSYPDAPSIP